MPKKRRKGVGSARLPGGFIDAVLDNYPFFKMVSRRRRLRGPSVRQIFSLLFDSSFLDFFRESRGAFLLRTKVC
jgi:hypothetical protein